MTKTYSVIDCGNSGMIVCPDDEAESALNARDALTEKHGYDKATLLAQGLPQDEAAELAGQI